LVLTAFSYLPIQLNISSLLFSFSSLLLSSFSIVKKEFNHYFLYLLQSQSTSASTSFLILIHQLTIDNCRILLREGEGEEEEKEEEDTDSLKLEKKENSKR